MPSVGHNKLSKSFNQERIVECGKCGQHMCKTNQRSLENKSKIIGKIHNISLAHFSKIFKYKWKEYNTFVWIMFEKKEFYNIKYT